MSVYIPTALPQRTDHRGRYSKQTMEADTGNRQYRPIQETDNGGRYRKQTVEADTGNRQWRPIPTQLAFLVSAMHFHPRFSFVSFSFLYFLFNVKPNVTWFKRQNQGSQAVVAMPLQLTGS